MASGVPPTLKEGHEPTRSSEPRAIEAMPKNDSLDPCPSRKSGRHALVCLSGRFRKRRLNAAPRGLTVVELMFVVAIAAILASIAVPSYQSYVYKTQVAQAATDIRALAAKIDLYYVDTN